MKILMIGGTQFVGRHIAAEFLEGGHELTLFHRGETNRGLFPEAREILGDRKTDLHRLQDEWDVVVDTCGYFPGEVRASAEHLVDRVEHYVFISTISVYRDLDEEGLDESAYVKTLEDPDVEDLNWTTYGPLKTECEGVVDGIFQERSLVVRPGVIAGPWDPTDRFTYWVWRVANGGDVLAPGPADASLQLIDMRDLASWIVRSVEVKRTGTFNATGREITFREMLRACCRATGSDAKFIWLSPEQLAELELDTEAKMPLWNPEGADRKAGFYAIDSDKARRAGLEHRPLEETARDTWRWIEECIEDHKWKVGIDLLQEREYLASLEE